MWCLIVVRFTSAEWSSPVARLAHTHKVTGSNPVSATNLGGVVKHYQIRFNTKAGPGDPLVWRVFEDGEERLAAGVRILATCYSEESWAGSEKKWNISCDGHAEWQDDLVIIW